MERNNNNKRSVDEKLEHELEYILSDELSTVKKSKTTQEKDSLILQLNRLRQSIISAKLSLTNLNNRNIIEQQNNAYIAFNPLPHLIQLQNEARLGYHETIFRLEIHIEYLEKRYTETKSLLHNFYFVSND